MDPTTGHLGQSIVIKGHVTAGEDLTIAGRVEGTINLQDHVLTIADTAQISAEITAKALHVMGTVNGNILATEKVELGGTASIKGDLKAARVTMVEGAVLQGRVDVPRSKEAVVPAAKTRRLPAAV